MNFLKVSRNNRYLTNQDNTPFFWLADTAWELIHRLTEDEAEEYFKKRSEQGFNVAQVVLISELDGTRIPNMNGDLPFSDLKTLEPDENYFSFVDRILELAERYKIYLALVPCWGDKVDRKEWGAGPEIWNPETIFKYGEFLGKRYSHVPNIVWINGGDRSGGGKNKPVWESLATGIKKWDKNHLMTFHPWGETSSSFWFHDSEWLDFNSCQSGHSARSFPNYMMIESDYNRLPVKPCLDMEPRYEAHPVNWKPDEYGRFDDYDIRQAAYSAIFSGAFGHTYGAHPVWQMAAEGRERIGFCNMNWREAIDLPGASQMQWLKNLVMSRNFEELMPDQSIIGAPKTGDEHVCACRGSNYLMVYIPNGGKVSVNLNLISGDKKSLWWFDPRTGKASDAGIVKTNSFYLAEAPSAVYREDWIFVADDLKAGFEIPNSKKPHPNAFPVQEGAGYR